MVSITPEIVRELLHYNPETGVFTWRERDHRWFKADRDCRAWNGKNAGSRAGNAWSSHGDGYRRRQIRLLGTPRLEHHLAWMWMTDEPLPLEIDHRNRDATDNRWMNLRAATHAENGRNQPMKRNNTSGVTGVYWHKRRCKWYARCKTRGKNHHLGYFDKAEDAAQAVAEFRAANGFDPGHGSELVRHHCTLAQPGA